MASPDIEVIDLHPRTVLPLLLTKTLLFKIGSQAGFKILNLGFLTLILDFGSHNSLPEGCSMTSTKVILRVKPIHTLP